MYNGPARGTDNRATSLAVSPGGGAVFVTGTSFGAQNPPVDYATVGYNTATGARLWVSRYSGPARESEAAALAVSPDGTKVFVTGATIMLSNKPWDYATVAYKR